MEHELRIKRVYEDLRQTMAGEFLWTGSGREV